MSKYNQGVDNLHPFSRLHGDVMLDAGVRSTVKNSPSTYTVYERHTGSAGHMDPDS